MDRTWGENNELDWPWHTMNNYYHMLDEGIENKGNKFLIQVQACGYVYVFINSFKDLYSTSSRKLLRGAPDSSTVKKNSFKLIIECV